MLATTTMPAINLDSIELTADERAIAELILNKGRLRASKPAVKRETVVKPITLDSGEVYNRKTSEPVGISGKAAYVWRMVAFTISPIGKHHCMPCTADFDLPERNYQARREMAKELDKLVDKIIASVPRGQHHGTMRWAKAMYGI